MVLNNDFYPFFHSSFHLQEPWGPHGESDKFVIPQAIYTRVIIYTDKDMKVTPKIVEERVHTIIKMAL